METGKDAIGQDELGRRRILSLATCEQIKYEIVAKQKYSIKLTPNRGG